MQTSDPLRWPDLNACASPKRDPNTCEQALYRGRCCSLLGAEGKALGRDFIVRLIKSGVKPTISGDLWSDGGMGLFGIYAHGISESWVMEKALIGLVACETERHTAENITKWTKDALLGIGLKAGDLLKPADGGA